MKPKLVVESWPSTSHDVGVLLKHGLCPRARQTQRFSFALRKVDEAVKIQPFAHLFAAAEPIAKAVAVVSIPGSTVTGLTLLLLLFSLHGFLRLRATTLAAPCLWITLSACALAAGTFLETRLAGITLSALRFGVAATTFCPLMAVLGARRPQHRGWQWVVLTLWIMLVWPAVQAVLLPAGVRVELFIAWRVFLWALIGLGLLNYLPTRHWLSALLVASGQTLLLREYLWPGEMSAAAWTWPLGVGCFLLAAVFVLRTSPLPSRNSQLATPNSQWQTFRDSFGTFWALRVLSRVNQAAELRGWPLHLDWVGFTSPPDQQLNEIQLAELDQTLSSLLRRFVAPPRSN